MISVIKWGITNLDSSQAAGTVGGIVCFLPDFLFLHCSEPIAVFKSGNVVIQRTEAATFAGTAFPGLLN